MNGTEVTGEEADRNRMLSRDQLLLYGSDEVIRAYDTWIRCADDAEHDLDHEGKLVSRLFLAIRKDLLGKTNLTESDIENLNPFNRG